MITNNTDTTTKNNLSISNLCERIWELCDTYRIIEKNIIVAVSGGADSMFLLWILRSFVEKRSGDLSKLFVVHYHHNVREEAWDDELLVRNCAQGMQYIWACRFKWIENEAWLRESRYCFLESIAKRLGENTVICTWHHLDDRIETTLLHLLRWASRLWMQNMRMFQKKKWYIHYRPLLRLQKHVIMDCVEWLKIPYVIDKTNTDSSVSLRNYIRKCIQDTWNKGWDKVEYMWNLGAWFLELYSALSHVEYSTEKLLSYSVLQPSPIRWDCEEYVLLHDTSVGGVYSVLFELHRQFWWYAKQLGVVASFFENKKTSWHIYIKGIYFFKSHGKCYLIRAQKKFWENRWDVGSMPWIKKDNLGEYGEVRGLMLWEKIWSKSLKKVFINRKIPIFRRNSIPILQKTPKVIEILLPEDTSCYW